MSSTLPTPNSASARADSLRRRTDAPALLVLDAQGRVLTANSAAGPLWAGEPADLIGRPFAALFAFEVVSDDPAMLEAQWEVLLATAVDQRIPLSIQLAEDAPAFPVRITLEPAAGAGAAWLAQVFPAPRAADQNPADTAARPGPSDAAGLLAASEAAGFFDLDFARNSTHYSPAWKRLLGYADADLANTYDTWLKLIHPEDSAGAPDQIGRHTRSSQRTFAVDIRMKHRRGHWVWIHSVGVQRFAPDGTLQRVVGFHLDISERKEIEDLGVIAEERLACLAESGGLAVFDLDFLAGRVWVSPAWSELVGAPVEYPDLGAFTQQFSAADGDLTGLLANFGGQDPWSAGNTLLRRSDRREVPVLLGLHRRVSRRGELLRVVGCALALPADPTGPGRPPPGPAGASTAVLNALGEALLLADRHGRIIQMNTKAERLTGRSAAAALGRPVDEVFRLVLARNGRPADDALELALVAETIPRLYTDHALLVDGAPPRPVAWTARQLWDDEGKIAGLAVIFRDPAEMSLTPEELIRANRFDSLGQLAGGIAHDFNNLLSTILGGISLAKDNRDYDRLSDAETACMAAKTLTRQLLAFAKGNPGGTFSVVRPADILRDAVRVAAAGSPVRVTVELDENAGPVEVDRGQMLQVYQNLIINAMQAMAEPSRGQIWIRCRNLTLAEGKLPPLPGGDYVQIEVQDNGAGIPADRIDRIFEPFFTTKKQGTGLGLATVLSIIRKHGGQLGVDSTVGVGTTFTTFLPASSKSLEIGVRRTATLRFGTGRVLFMDDDPHLVEITKAMLESLDYKVDVARHGEEALTLYRRYHNVNRPYDVVLLDLTIVGGMGGEETFKRLREIDPDVRAIVSSGYDNEEMARQFLESGFCGYLTKPYRVGELGKMLKSVLGA